MPPLIPTLVRRIPLLLSRLQPRPRLLRRLIHHLRRRLLIPHRLLCSRQLPPLLFLCRDLLVFLDQRAAAAAAGDHAVVAAVALDAVLAAHGAPRGHLQHTLEWVEEHCQRGPAHALCR